MVLMAGQRSLWRKGYVSQVHCFVGCARSFDGLYTQSLPKHKLTSHASDYEFLETISNPLDCARIQVLNNDLLLYRNLLQFAWVCFLVENQVVTTAILKHLSPQDLEEFRLGFHGVLCQERCVFWADVHMVTELCIALPVDDHDPMRTMMNNQNVKLVPF